MKISNIHIDRFGVWEDFDQTIKPNGLTVFYGTNGTGKTTLLRFLRAMLYGFTLDDRQIADRWRDRFSREGSLEVQHQGRTHRLHRMATLEGDAGRLTIDGLDAAHAAKPLYEELIGHLDARLFQSVFALGLPELQQLGTLEDEAVARHIYAMTLGPQGRQLQDAVPKLESYQRAIRNPQAMSGKLLELAQQRTRLRALNEAESTRLKRHRELLRKREQLETRQENLTSRQTNLQAALLEARHLQRVWEPWRLVGQCQRELSGLPELQAIAPDTISKLDRIEAAIVSLGQDRDTARSRVLAIEEKLKSARKLADFGRFGPSLHALWEHQPAWQNQDAHRLAAEQELNTVEQDLTRRLKELGPKWTRQRLSEIVDTPATHAELLSSARGYQDMRARQLARQRRYRKKSSVCHDRELALRTTLLELGIQSETIEEPLHFARQRLAHVVELGRLRIAAGEHLERIREIEKQLERIRVHSSMPPWIFTLLFLFLAAGVGLLFWGALTSITTGVLVGTIYALVGVMAISLSYGLKVQFERDAEDQLRAIRESRRDYQVRLHEAREQMRDLAQTHDLMDAAELEQWMQGANDGGLIAQAAARLADLEKLQRQFQEIRRVRKSLSAARKKLQEGQRELAQARHDWSRKLAGIGLDETTSVSNAYSSWEKVHGAFEQLARSRELSHRLNGIRSEQQAFRQKVETLAKRIGQSLPATANPWLPLENWRKDLTTALEKRKAKRKLDRMLEARQELRFQLDRKLEQQHLDRTAMLSAAGVRDREGLIDRIKTWEKRKEWELRLKQAQHDLEQAVQSQPTLAITEDVLQKFNRTQNDQRIGELTKDLAIVEQDLKKLYEELGSVKQETRTLEADTSGMTRRLELATLEQQMRTGLEDWYAAALAGQSMEELRQRFERTNQPQLLAEASPFLSKLTCGQYPNIWTPLGQHALCVDDDRQQPWPVQMLSGGTREQLFLAIRLAMVRRFTARNVELPMILDDVTVNFDEHRSGAAVDTLIDFASTGQQVLVFTSHMSFAEQFQSRGVEPVWLSRLETQARRAG